MPRLLYVDDEPDNIDLLSRRLSRRGFEVRGTTSAADGLAVAAEWKPDLILMDIKMPVMDGYEATTRLKADPATAAIPVIALTAHAMREDEERAKAAGVDDYATKPVDLPVLLEKIAKLIPPAG
jgi:CheY-like chemotaxis protein